MMVLVEEERSIEEGLLELSNQSDASGCRITACVILSTFVAVCGSFSFGVAIGYTSGAEIGIMKDMGLSIAEFSAFASLSTLGATFGALFSGKMAILLGRRGVMTKMLERDSKSRFSDLFQRKYRHIIVVGVGLMLIQQFSGSTAVISYTSTIFSKAGFSVTIGSTLLGIFMVPKATIGLILVDKWGRRPLLLTSACGMSITCMFIGLAFTLQKMQLLPKLTPVLTFLCVTLYIASYAVGIGGLPWIIMSEIFPMNIKVTAGTLVTLASWSSSSIVTYAFSFLFEWSTEGTFYIFGAIGGTSLIFIWLLVPETKGLSLEEIQASLTRQPNEINRM
ncbi:unnamed protein product [Brassica rapa subsp. trilocularis]